MGAGGFDPETLAFYAAEAPVYTASGPKGTSRSIEPFLGRLPQAALILELGCGGGRDAAFMIEAGFQVEPTDGTPEIARQAEALLGMPVGVMRFDQLDAVDRYDAIIANAALLHVPRPALADVLARIWRALKPGGWHLATYKGGGIEGRDRFGRYFNYLSREEAEAQYRAAGDWTVLVLEEGMGGGYDGVQGPWIKIEARKPG